jgi:hypothetical protein
MSAFSISCFILSVMDGKIEQCVYIKFCVKLSKSATETPEVLREVFGQQSLSWTAIFEWHSCFKAGRVSVEYDEFSGQPSIWDVMEFARRSQQRM